MQKDELGRVSLVAVRVNRSGMKISLIRLALPFYACLEEPCYGGLLAT